MKEENTLEVLSLRGPHLEREIDQMKKAMDEMKDSMRGANHVDDLVHRTNSSFTTSITSHSTLQVQNAYLGLIRWNARSL